MLSSLPPPQGCAPRNSVPLELGHGTLGQLKHLKVLPYVKTEDVIMSWLEMCKIGEFLSHRLFK